MSSFQSTPEGEQYATLMGLFSEHYDNNRMAEAETIGVQICQVLEGALVEHANEVKPGLAILLYDTANMAGNRGDMRAAIERYRKAIGYIHELREEDPKQPEFQNLLGQSSFNLGNTYMSIGHGEDAGQMFRQAKEVWQLLTRQDPVTPGYQHDLARAHFNLAYIHQAMNEPEEAQHEYAQARDVWLGLIDVHGNEPAYVWDLARSYFNHAMSLHETGATDGAKESMQESIRWFEVLANEHPNVPEYQQSARQSHEALANFDRPPGRSPDELANMSMADLEKLVDEEPDSPELRAQLGSKQLQHIGTLLDQQAPHETLLQEYYKARDILEPLARDHPTPHNRNLLAITYFDLGIEMRAGELIDEPEEYHRRSRKMLQELRKEAVNPFDVEHFLAGVYNHLGILYADTGRVRQAEEAYQRAIELRQKQIQQHPDHLMPLTFLGGSYCNMGNVTTDQGKYGEAREWYAKSIQVLEDTKKRARAVQGQFQQYANATVSQVDQFLSNAKGGQQRVEREVKEWAKTDWLKDGDTVRPPVAAMATSGWSHPGPTPQFSEEYWPKLDFPPEPEQALGVIDEYIATHNHDLVGQLCRGRILSRLGRHNEALESFDRAMREAREFLASADEASSQWGQLQRLVSVIACDIADASRFGGQTERALQEVDEVLKTRANNARAWYIKGLVLGRFLGPEGRVEGVDFEAREEAVKCFDEAIVIDPEDFDVRFAKGLTCAMLANAAQSSYRVHASIASEQLSDELAKIYGFVHSARFWCYLKRAEETFARAASLRPDDPRPLFERGMLVATLLGPSEGSRALADFSRVVELDPTNAEAWYELANLVHAQGDTAKAKEHLQKAIELEPSIEAQAREEFSWYSAGDRSRQGRS